MFTLIGSLNLEFLKNCRSLSSEECELYMHFHVCQDFFAFSLFLFRRRNLIDSGAVYLRACLGLYPSSDAVEASS